jgi:hypothetical protein
LSHAPILASTANAVSYDQLPTLAAAGLGVDVRPLGLPGMLRLSALRGIARQEVGRWGCADPAGNPLPCPSVLIEVPTDIGATQVAADAVGGVAVANVVVRPIVGLAWVRYEYAWDPGPAGSFSLEPGEFTDDAWAFRYGAGLGIPLGRVTVELERVRHRTNAERRQPGEAGTTTVGVSIPLSEIG